MNDDINKTDTAADNAAMDQTTCKYKLDPDYTCWGAEIGKDMDTGERVFRVKGAYKLEHELAKGEKGIANMIPINRRPKAEQDAIRHEAQAAQTLTKHKRKDIRDVMDTVLSRQFTKEQAVSSSSCFR